MAEICVPFMAVLLGNKINQFSVSEFLYIQQILLYKGKLSY